MLDALNTYTEQAEKYPSAYILIFHKKRKFTGKKSLRNTKNTGIPHFIAVYFIVLCNNFFSFYKLKVCGNPVSGIFPTALILKLKCVHCFYRHNTIEHLTDCTTV